VVLGSSARLLPPLPSPLWTPGLATYDVTVPGSSVPNGLYLWLQTYNRGAIHVEVSSVSTCEEDGHVQVTRVTMIWQHHSLFYLV
jgi:hypothetical protein